MFNNFSYLYVEDDFLSREIMSLIIRGGMDVDNVELFEDSHNFMERVRALPFRPDIFLLDIHILPIDGYEMLKQLRADSTYEKSKIIAVTASVRSDDDRRLHSAGFDGAIAKPLSAETLPKLLEHILNGESIWHI